LIPSLCKAKNYGSKISKPWRHPDIFPCNIHLYIQGFQFHPEITVVGFIIHKVYIYIINNIYICINVSSLNPMKFSLNPMKLMANTSYIPLNLCWNHLPGQNPIKLHCKIRGKISVNRFGLSPSTGNPQRFRSPAVAASLRRLEILVSRPA
jgi:hypothetical protein